MPEPVSLGLELVRDVPHLVISYSANGIVQMRRLQIAALHGADDLSRAASALRLSGGLLAPSCLGSVAALLHEAAAWAAIEPQGEIEADEDCCLVEEDLSENEAHSQAPEGGVVDASIAAKALEALCEEDDGVRLHGARALVSLTSRPLSLRALLSGPAPAALVRALAGGGGVARPTGELAAALATALAAAARFSAAHGVLQSTWPPVSEVLLRCVSLEIKRASMRAAARSRVAHLSTFQANGDAAGEAAFRAADARAIAVAVATNRAVGGEPPPKPLPANVAEAKRDEERDRELTRRSDGLLYAALSGLLCLSETPAIAREALCAGAGAAATALLAYSGNPAVLLRAMALIRRLLPQVLAPNPNPALELAHDGAKASTGLPGAGASSAGSAARGAGGGGGIELDARAVAAALLPLLSLQQAQSRGTSASQLPRVHAAALLLLSALLARAAADAAEADAAAVAALAAMSGGQGVSAPRVSAAAARLAEFAEFLLAPERGLGAALAAALRSSVARDAAVRLLSQLASSAPSALAALAGLGVAPLALRVAADIPPSSPLPAEITAACAGLAACAATAGEALRAPGSGEALRCLAVRAARSAAAGADDATNAQAAAVSGTDDAAAALRVMRSLAYASYCFQADAGDTRAASATAADAAVAAGKAPAQAPPPLAAYRSAWTSAVPELARLAAKTAPPLAAAVAAPLLGTLACLSPQDMPFVRSAASGAGGGGGGSAPAAGRQSLASALLDTTLPRGRQVDVASAEGAPHSDAAPREQHGLIALLERCLDPWQAHAAARRSVTTGAAAAAAATHIGVGVTSRAGAAATGSTRSFAASVRRPLSLEEDDALLEAVQLVAALALDENAAAALAHSSVPARLAALLALAPDEAPADTDLLLQTACATARMLRQSTSRGAVLGALLSCADARESTQSEGDRLPAAARRLADLSGHGCLQLAADADECLVAVMDSAADSAAAPKAAGGDKEVDSSTHPSLWTELRARRFAAHNRAWLMATATPVLFKFSAANEQHQRLRPRLAV